MVICGAFGSGKSEYAINLAMNLAKSKPESVALVDLDLVNAYFRSREVQGLLESNDVRLVAPQDAVRFSDLPIAGPGIPALIKKSASRVIIDVGGDPMGAVALASLNEHFDWPQVDVLMVVNPCRPFTADLAAIRIMKDSLEKSGKMRVSGLVSNPHIGPGSSPELILRKHQLLVSAGEELNLPLREILVYRPIWETDPELFARTGLFVRPLEIYLTPEWLIKQQKEDCDHWQH